MHADRQTDRTEIIQVYHAASLVVSHSESFQTVSRDFDWLFLRHHAMWRITLKEWKYEAVSLKSERSENINENAFKRTIKCVNFIDFFNFT